MINVQIQIYISSGTNESPFVLAGGFEKQIQLTVMLRAIYVKLWGTGGQVNFFYPLHASNMNFL